jgi:hypothetical protein
VRHSSLLARWRLALPLVLSALVVARDPAEITNQTDAGEAERSGSHDAGEDTDMTGGALPDDTTEQSDVAVEAAAGGGAHGGGRRKNRRRR